MNSVNLIGIYKIHDNAFRTFTKSDGEEGRVLNFSLGIYKGKDKTIWIQCKAFDNNVQFAQEYLVDKMRIGISGRIDVEEWQDNDGNNRKKTVIVLDSYRGFHFCEKKDENYQGSTQQQPAAAAASAAAQLSTDEIPF